MPLLEQSTIENIYKSVLKFLGPLSLEETYKRIVDEAVRLSKGEYGCLILKQGSEFIKIYSSSSDNYTYAHQKEAYTYQAFTARRSIIFKSTLYIPLSYRNKSIGVVFINSKKESNFRQKDLEVLNLFGSMASLAIRKSQLTHETEKALQTRDMFISMASHELRTPLTTISGYVQLLKSKIHGQGGATKTWMEELSKEVERLTLLVKELLEINRIKSGNLQYHYKESNIYEICDRAVKTIEFGHPNKKIVLENKLGKDDMVIGDYDKLIQAISNILENAAKYSPNGQEIKMTLTKRNNQLRIVVKDKGIGIPSTELLEIFKGYVQGKNHTREGLGLGLFLTKSIIEKHLGHINIKSKENRGTTVEVFLPKINSGRS